MSASFCRDLLANSLPFWFYFQNYIAKLLNLVLLFVGSCDATGAFSKSEQAEFLMLTGQSRINVIEMSKCREALNRPTWLHFCKGICQQYRLAELNESFFPYVEKAVRLIDFIYEQLDRIEASGRQSQVHVFPAKKRKASVKGFQRTEQPLDATQELQLSKPLS